MAVKQLEVVVDSLERALLQEYGKTRYKYFTHFSSFLNMKVVRKSEFSSQRALKP